MKKFELTSNTKMWFGRKLFQIKALISFGNVKEGELGGYIEKEGNLDHDGDAWVCGDAWVYGNAKVCGDAKVYGNAKVCGDADYATVKGFGTEFRTTTFFKCNDGVTRVICGCFYGDLNEFREQVKNTRTGKIAEEYLMIADLMEKHFKEGESQDV